MAYKRKSTKKWSKKGRSKKVTSSFAAKVKKVILKTAEPKHKNFEMAGTSLAPVSLKHNTVEVRLVNSGNGIPNQGDSQNERIGDQINASGWMIRMMIGQKPDRPNVTFKYWVLEVPKGEVYVYNSWFENVTNTTVLDPINKDMCHVIKSGIWKPHNGSMDNATDEYTFTRTIHIPYKRKIKFPRGSSQTHDMKDLYLVMTVYDAFGTLQTDSVAYYSAVSTLYYKDP